MKEEKVVGKKVKLRKEGKKVKPTKKEWRGSYEGEGPGSKQQEWQGNGKELGLKKKKTEKNDEEMDNR